VKYVERDAYGNPGDNRHCGFPTKTLDCCLSGSAWPETAPFRPRSPPRCCDVNHFSDVSPRGIVGMRSAIRPLRPRGPMTWATVWRVPCEKFRLSKLRGFRSMPLMSLKPSGP